MDKDVICRRGIAGNRVSSCVFHLFNLNQRPHWGISFVVSRMNESVNHLLSVMKIQLLHVIPLAVVFVLKIFSVSFSYVFGCLCHLPS